MKVECTNTCRVFPFVAPACCIPSTPVCIHSEHLCCHKAFVCSIRPCFFPNYFLNLSSSSSHSAEGLFQILPAAVVAFLQQIMLTGWHLCWPYLNLLPDSDRFIKGIEKSPRCPVMLQTRAKSVCYLCRSVTDEQ